MEIGSHPLALIGPKIEQTDLIAKQIELATFLIYCDQQISDCCTLKLASNGDGVEQMEKSQSIRNDQVVWEVSEH